MLDRGASLPLIGLSYTTFALPIIFTAPLSGRLSDRYGRYWLFLSGLLLTGVIFCLYSLPSVTAWPIIFISIAEGIVTSIARSSLDGLLADIIPRCSREGTVQLYSGGFDWKFDWRYRGGITLRILHRSTFFH